MIRVYIGIYRLLLWVLPRAALWEYREESVALFGRVVREARAEGGVGPAFGTAIRGYVGLATGAMEEAGRATKELGSGSRTVAAQAIRAVSRAPWVSAGVVSLFVLGIAPVVTVFSVIDGVLLRGFPYPDAERLVVVEEGAHTWPDFRDWSQTVGAFDTLAAASGQTFTLTSDRPQDIEGARVSEEFFAITGASVAYGRLPTAAEYRTGRRVTVLDHSAWQTRWGSDPGIVGRQIPVDGEPVEVVGVLGPSFVAPEVLTGSGVEIWVPIDPTDPELDQHSRSFAVLGRLAPGATLDRARFELAARADVFARQFPDTHAADDGSPSRTFPPVSLAEATSGDVRGPLLLLLVGSGLLLVVASGNAASLLLARNLTRRGELAVRHALGGNRSTILGQLVTESAALALFGGAAGIGLAFLGVDLLRALEPGDLPRIGDVAVNLRVASACLGISLVVGVATGTFSALWAGGVSPAAALRKGDGSRSHRRAQGQILIGIQAAMASVLLIGSITLVRGFTDLVRTDPGFEPGGVYAMELNVGRDVPEAQRGEDLRSILTALDELPEVTDLGAGLAVPFEISGGRRCCWLGELEAGDRTLESVWVHPVTDGYFEALGMPLQSGRPFEPDDRSINTVPVVLNAEAARALFGSESGVGERLTFAEWEMEVVGVIQNAHHWGVDQPIEAEFYVPYDPMGAWASGLTVAIRGHGPPSREQLLDAVAGVAPRAVVGELRAMDDLISASVARQRFFSLVLTTFAACALLLASAGLAGALLYETRLRRFEMAVRLAIGSSAVDLVRRSVLHGLWPFAVGAVAGLAATWPLRTRLDALMPGVEPVDPLSLLLLAGALLASALLAIWLPSRVAVRTSPMAVFR